jgi:Uma2 family endonuclease
MILSHKRQQVPIVSVVERRTKGRNMSLQSYMDWKPEDGFKYEWNDGVLEKLPYNMTQQELFILRNLRSTLQRTSLSRTGDFYAEVRVPTAPAKVRIPDIAFCTNDQITEAAHGARFVPSFVAEIISTMDTIRRVDAKMYEYFAAGVQTLWHIKSEQLLVEIYTSPKLVTRCFGADVCSGAPALAAFSLTTDELFAPLQVMPNDRNVVH